MPMKPCPACSGTGKQGDRLCKQCSGTCFAPEPEHIKNDIPDVLKDLFNGFKGGK